MKKKVAVVTIVDNNPNFGNKLQNYAAIQIMRTFGFGASTLLPEKRRNDYWRMYVMRVVTKLTGRTDDTTQAIRIKNCKFNEFDLQYLSINSHYIRGKDIQKEYDYFAVGSDQVWNPEWWNTSEHKKEAFLLTFARPEQKVCLAPSFGKEQLDDGWKDFFRKHLKTFPNLSVREPSGAELIKELTGQDAEVVIDPTLMLSAKAWRDISKKPGKVDFSKKYILTYFLGETSDKAEQMIAELRTKEDLAVYHIMDIQQPEIFASGPREFLYLIEHADLVLTDSFHACVFSFIFERPFLVFERNGAKVSMFSRIENLLDTLHLQRKFVNSGQANDLFECDYAEGKTRIHEEQKKAYDYLKKSLKITD